MKMVVEFNDPRVPPQITLEGEGWSRQKLDVTYRQSLRALKLHKRRLLDEGKRESKEREEALAEAFALKEKGKEEDQAVETYEGVDISDLTLEPKKGRKVK
jgi:hypothetical protein